jgi:hypothetical protein
VKHYLFAIALMGSALIQHQSASAQSMYRCGSAFQDRPCEGSDGKIVGSTKSAAPTTQKQSGNLACQQRAENAKKLMWARETGKSAEALTESAIGNEAKRLVADVYRKKGSSTEVALAIEADCVVEHERAQQAAKLEAQAAILRGQTPAASGLAQASPRAPNANEPTTPSSQDRARNEATAAAEKTQQCNSFKSRVDGIISQQRAGGSISAMEQLHRQRQQAEKSARDAGC